jgi:hypothetical protein
MATIYIESTVSDEIMAEIVEYVQREEVWNCNLPNEEVKFARDLYSWIDCKEEYENEYAELLWGIFSIIRSHA